MSIGDINNFLPIYLNEVIKEKFFEQEKGLDMQNLLNDYDDANKILSACIEELRVYIYSASRVYKYCISWSVAIMK